MVAALGNFYPAPLPLLYKRAKYLPLPPKYLFRLPLSFPPNPVSYVTWRRRPLATPHQRIITRLGKCRFEARRQPVDRYVGRGTAPTQGKCQKRQLRSPRSLIAENGNSTFACCAHERDCLEWQFHLSVVRPARNSKRQFSFATCLKRQFTVMNKIAFLGNLVVYRRRQQ